MTGGEGAEPIGQPAAKLAVSSSYGKGAAGFVRWAGSKRALAAELLARAPVAFSHYHEPFLGAGWLFWTLANARRLRKGYVSLSDTCEPLVRAWRGVKDRPEGVIGLLAQMPITSEHYYAIRSASADDQRELTDEEVAAWFIYVNKTSFNGVHRVNRAGKFNVPWGRWEEQGRVPTVLDGPLLRKCSEAMQAVEASLTVRSFETVLDYAKKGDFVYFDPPYIPTSKTADFTSYTAAPFKLEAHTLLRDVALELKKRGVYVMLSNADVPLVRELYERWFNIDVVEAPRSVNSKGTGRGKVKEVIIR